MEAHCEVALAATMLDGQLPRPRDWALFVTSDGQSGAAADHLVDPDGGEG
jgi:hypothetical protein